MAYATISDVTALNPARTIGASSIPNQTQVAGYITETAAVLDSILAGLGFALPVPVTATVALELLEHFNAIGAWSLMETAAPNSPHVEAAQAAWASAQKMLASGKIEPAGLSRDMGTTRARAAGVATPYFSRCMEL